MKNLKMIALLIAGMLVAAGANAAPRIAVLSFELNDITSLPNIPQEKARTATFRPLLEQALAGLGDYNIVSIDSAAQTAANSSFGYLYRFNDLAAKLGGQVNADWIVVGQHSKPSFLFSHLMVNVINVKNPAVASSFDVELKGTHEKVSQRSVKALAGKIDVYLRQLPLTALLTHQP